MPSKDRTCGEVVFEDLLTAILFGSLSPSDRLHIRLSSRKHQGIVRWESSVLASIGCSIPHSVTIAYDVDFWSPIVAWIAASHTDYGIF